MTSTETASPVSKWRFWIPLILQTALIAAVPAQAVYTHLTGKTVVLQTAPVDPYDLLRGYSVTLGYDISSVNTLKSLPGWKTLPKQPNSPGDYVVQNSTMYVVLQAPTDSGKGRPAIWKPVAVSRDRPNSLPPNQVALKGRSNYSQIEYGLETYYMPENQRDEVNKTIREAQRKQQGAVEVKVDAQGNAVPIKIWVGDRSYQF